MSSGMVRDQDVDGKVNEDERGDERGVYFHVFLCLIYVCTSLLFCVYDFLLCIFLLV